MWALFPDDLAPFADLSAEQAEALIAQAESTARVVAPCLAEGVLSEDQLQAIKGILVGAVLRWHASGYGNVSQEVAGPNSVSYDKRVRRGQFWPSEIRDLQRICGTTRASGRAHTIYTGPAGDALTLQELLRERPDLRLQFG